MKKIIYVLSALMLLSSCEEWQPVFTGKYEEPAKYKDKVLKPTHTIAELCAMYRQGQPLTFIEDIIIAGKVNSTDQPGNFYKSFYIQDETAGIEIKVGRNALYNVYQPGQTVYVRCMDLTLGMYGFKTGNYGGQGMIQLGFTDPTYLTDPDNGYETSYIESPLIIDTHILCGPKGAPVVPEVLKESDLPNAGSTQVTNPYLGKLVTLKGLKYANEVFVLLYLDSNADKKAAENRVFLSDTNGSEPIDKTHGVTTWAMSKDKMTEYLKSGIWDDLKIGSGNTFTGQTLADFKGDGSYPKVEKAAYSVSQYFKMGNAEIQVRSSGFSKFADYEIDPAVLSGDATIDITGVLTLYQGSLQLVINSLDDVKVNK